MIKFGSFQGTVTKISDFMTEAGEIEGCRKLVSVQNESGNVVNFVVLPTTYFVGHTIVSVGDRITGYYDLNAPAILIYPPQYPALVMAKNSSNLNIKADYFDNQLVSSDGMLKLNITPYTRLVLTNDQPFTGNPANRNLIVIYGPATMSIPAQTTPYEIIVYCA